VSPETRPDELREGYVVCVDDDADFVKSLELFLPGQINESSPGPVHRFLFFTDPEEALQVLHEIVPGQGVLAMVISDQQMPHMKGTAFLSRIRERYPDCVRVLLTGHAGLDSAIAAINERLLDKYMTKPVDNEHDFTVSVRLLLQRFWMQRTIVEQRRTIEDLYRFSNALNALSDLPSTIRQTTSFASDALGYLHLSVWLIEGSRLVLQSPEGGAATTSFQLQGPEVAGWSDAPGPKRIAGPEDAPWAAALTAWHGKTLPAYPFVQTVLTSGSEVLGLLLAGEKQDGAPFDDEDLETLTYIGDTASIALYNQLRRAELAKAYEASSAQAVALAAANERLRMLDRLKDDFLSFVSHELRTPVSVLAAVEFLQPAPDSPRQTELVDILRHGYRRLKRFIERALAYQSWIAGERSRPAELVDFVELIRDAVARTRGLSDPDAHVSMTLGGPPCRILGSAPDLTEAVRVLLDNAVKFSPEKKWVEIRCENDGARVRLSVTDRGTGFPPELAEELLKPFTIADSLHHASGSAISLAKAAAIVISHGGEIQARSDGPGSGAEFTIHLPLAGAGHTLTSRIPTRITATPAH